jgi:hypothetical protein
MLPALALVGCAIQGGASMSRLGSFSDPHAPHVWAGHLAAHARFSTFVAGAEVEGVGSKDRWSGFTIEVLVLGDVGVPVGWSADSGMYLGWTVEVPIALEGGLPVTERNRNLRIVSGHTQIAPFVRMRYYFDRHDERDDSLFGVSVGLALRVKYSTDLLDLGTR